MRARILGAVLAGGASSRFGSDKAMAVLDGRTLLDHAAAMLADHVDEVVVVGRGEVDDLPAPGLGPLGGIAGALAYGERQGLDSVMTIGCDMPDVPVDLLAALLECAPSYCSDAPVLGHWPVALAPVLLAHLSARAPSPRPRAGVQGSPGTTRVVAGQPWMPGRARHDGARPGRDAALSVSRWAIDIGALAIPSPVPLRNVNTTADLPSS